MAGARPCAGITPVEAPAKVWPPFTRYAVAAVVGSTGLGVDVSTPLSEFLNVRVGGTYLGLSRAVVQQGYPIDAHLRLGTGRAMVDFYPKAGAFHLSAGVLLPNLMRATGTAIVPGHQELDLGGVGYRSDPANPMGITAYVRANRVDPAITVGWGNPISRDYHKHWSFPTELGVAYEGVPSFGFDVTGSACTNVCAPVTVLRGFQTNLNEFRGEIHGDLSRYARFYPILSTGVSYRF